MEIVLTSDLGTSFSFSGVTGRGLDGHLCLRGGEAVARLGSVGETETVVVAVLITSEKGLLFVMLALSGLRTPNKL